MAQLKAGTTIDGQTAWHAGNDGPGSTLDADTLDGSHASAFALSGHAHALDDLSDVTITTPADNSVLAYDSGTSTWIDQTAAEAGLATSSHNHDADYVSKSGSSQIIDNGVIQLSPTGDTNTFFRIGHNGLHSTKDGTLAHEFYIRYDHDGGKGWSVFNGLDGPSGTYYKIWHENNDGAGSGLDADTVDGSHASDFATSSHNHDATYVNTTGDTMTGALTIEDANLLMYDTTSGRPPWRINESDSGSLVIAYQFDNAAEPRLELIAPSSTSGSGATLEVDGDPVVINIGTATDAIAIGNFAEASANFSTALGSGANATTSEWTTAIGGGAAAWGANATAVGASSSAASEYAVALGAAANASGLRSVSIGVAASNGERAISIGDGAVSSKVESIAIGRNATVNPSSLGTHAIAIGSGATAAGSFDAEHAIAIGSGATASTQRAIAIGLNANAVNGFDPIAIGQNSVAGGQNAIVIGRSAKDTSTNGSIIIGNAAEPIAAGFNQIILGNAADSGGNYSISIGNFSIANGLGTIAMGRSANASHAEAVAIGYNAATTAANQGVLGVADGGTGPYNWVIPGNLNVGGTVSHGGTEGYLYSETVVFTSSGTFSKASYPGIRAVRVRAVGGGGGGGSPANADSGAPGGGGGGYAESLLLESSLAASETVTVGSGGAAGTAGGDGGSGGTSSFGSHLSANGGSGGTATGSTIGLGGLGGSASGGNIMNVTGGGGQSTGNPALYTTAGIYPAGTGGGSILGTGGRAGAARASNWAGGPGNGYGGGGAGGYNRNSTTSGGAGASGIVLVDIYV